MLISLHLHWMCVGNCKHKQDIKFYGSLSVDDIM